MSEERPLIERLTFPRRVTEEKYPWEQWLDGHVWKLSQGEDFDVDLESFRSAIYMAASRKGIRVKTHIPKQRDCIYVQVKS
jgi:hypothetical protein